MHTAATWLAIVGPTRLSISTGEPEASMAGLGIRTLGDSGTQRAYQTFLRLWRTGTDFSRDGGIIVP